MRHRWQTVRRALWIALLLSVPAGFVAGSLLLREEDDDRSGPGTTVADVPRHLLDAECAQALEIPDDDDADPVLVPGCDEVARSAFFTRMIAATVTVSVDGFPAGSDRLKYGGGTGVVIDHDGSILTANHVIEDAVSVTVHIRELSSDGQSVKTVRDVPVDVIAVSKEHDAALLRPRRKVPMPAPLPIRFLRPDKDEQVWHFGKTTTWAAGKVTDLFHVWNPEPGRKIITVGAAIRGNQGDSGGPFVTDDGRLVGIMLAVTNDKKTSFFLPVADALTALGEPKDAGICLPDAGK
jgi:S1-C subfamily serine protease